MSLTPDKIWWTAAEIAEAGLPDLPSTKRGMTKVAERQGWQSDPDNARRRAGRGGGWEYHWSLLPSRARALLLSQASPKVADTTEARDRDAVWAWFESLPTGPKARAATRLATIQKAEALERGGLTRDQAVRDAAVLDGVSARSVWNWLGLVEGVRADDRLAYLAPRHRAKPRKSRAITVDPDFGDLIKSDYLRPEEPSLSSVFRRQTRVAKAKGIEVVPLHTVRRWLERSVSPLTVILMRKGVDALKAMYPPQVRDKTAMHAMEAVNGDFHRFDVFVKWPGQDKPLRPQMVAFQDVHSGRILSWRVDVSANSHAVQMCIGDMIETWGIPDHVLLDNGREFAAKAITGGSKTRFRFKIKDDDVPGLLTSLGCDIHWATPYSGQSKPIERVFRGFCDDIAKDPRLAGAYTGNKPGAQPENWGDRAVPLEEFLAVLAEGIEEHNTRTDRRSEVAYGRSFAEVFDESYASAPIRKATAEQRRLWLMGAEGVRPNKLTGSISFMGNEYWADWVHSHRGEKLVARFDTAALWDGLHLYALSGEYLGHVACRQKAGFFDVEDARVHSRARGDWLKAEKAAAKAHKRLTAAELGQALDEATPETTDAQPVAAKVVRLAQGPKVAPSVMVVDPEIDAKHRAMVADLTAHRAARAPDANDPAEDFDRARALERQIENGGDLTKDQHKWLAGYQTTPEYRARRAMAEEYGEDALGK